jgi:predicted MFS family arabinose efflux permease
MDLGIGLGSWIFGVALQAAGVAGLYSAATLLVLLTLPALGLYRATARSYNYKDEKA